MVSSITAGEKHDEFGMIARAQFVQNSTREEGSYATGQ
jgi:hypothetical protein